MDNLYTYRIYWENVVDAVMIDVDIDMGFKINTRQRIRLLRVDAPGRYTVRGEELAKGVEDWLGNLDPLERLYVTTHQSDGSGYVGEIFAYNELFGQKRSLNDWLLQQLGVKEWERRA